MTDHQIQAQLRGMIADLAHVGEGFSAGADVFREIGLQSAAALDLLLQMEEEFDIAIDDAAFAKERTLSQMTALVVQLRRDAQ
jgi:acyl carrier protein